MTRRRIAEKGGLIALGIVMLTAFVAFLQIQVCNREGSEGEGSWVARCWVYEQEDVRSGTARIRFSPDSEPISVPTFRVDTHWHPLALAGWALPPALALAACAIAVRRRNSRAIRLGVIAALLVLAAAYFISPLIAWGIGP